MHWIFAQWLAIAAVAGASGLAFAEGIDLSKVDRSIRREPDWTSGEPQYCLFVVSAERRVWFVVDGDDLYMDINGNSDLTDPGEKLPQLKLSSEERIESRNYSRWRIPDIKGIEGEPIITNIHIYPNRNRGAESGSKFVYFVLPDRRRAFTRPIFADTPADAPILHPTGPHRLGVEVRPSHPPREQAVSNVFHVTGYLYVEGLGPGTRFILGTSTLDCRIEFPLADGRTEVKEMRLRDFINGPYQTVSARLPEGVVNDGTVKITLSRTPSARGFTVKPVVIEKPVAELRAVRRENKAAAVRR